MWSRSATPGGRTSPLSGEVDLPDIRRCHVVLLDDIRDATARYGLVPSTEVIGQGVTPATEVCDAMPRADRDGQQGDVGHAVPETMPFYGPAIPRGRFERHDPAFAADELRQRQRHESLVGAHVPHGFTVANQGRKNLDTTSYKGVVTVDTLAAYGSGPHVEAEARVNTNGHTSEDPLSCVTDGERQLHGGSIGTFPSMYSSS